ncbi:MAG: hypothetical protein JNL82_33345 [Myxococcales bacterium]|nr:hypothetical protein [Myxococcales bacterium]
MSPEHLQIAAIAAGLLVALLGLLRLRRDAGPARGRPITLTATHRLHVVEIDGRRLLIGTGPGGPPQLVAELAEAPAWAQDDWVAKDGR